MHHGRLTWAWHEHEHWLTVIDERDGAVLQFTRSKAFSVNVGDLFQLERTLECGGEAHMATQEEHRASVCHPVRELGNLLVCLDGFGHMRRQGLERENRVPLIFGAQRAANSPEVQTDQVERGDLRGKGLR